MDSNVMMPLDFFLLSKKFGNKCDSLYYIIGICYLFGVNNLERAKKELPLGLKWKNWDNFIEAKNYFQLVKDKSIYDYGTYAYMSILYGYFHLRGEEALENDRLGAEQDFENCLVSYGLRLIRKAQESYEKTWEERQKMYYKGLEYMKASFSAKSAFWIAEFHDSISKERKQKYIDYAVKSWHEGTLIDVPIL